MDAHLLAQALQQALQNYHRCGLRWLPTETPASTLPDLGSLLAATEAQPSKDQPARSPRPAAVAAIADPSSRPMPAQSARPAHAIPGQPPTRPADIVGHGEAGQWLRQPLNDNERQTTLDQLSREVRSCQRCQNICQFRQQTVFGVGPLRPSVCFMGEAPGADEDRLGEPFVGRAGQLLTKIIAAMQLQREQVYILNALKCRPPGNRTPVPEEIANCRPFVEAQLETLQPRYIVCLGAVAVRSLLGLETAIGRLRGRFFHYRGARVVVTYHPSYLLRNEQAKRLVWEDMQMLMRDLGLPISGKS